MSPFESMVDYVPEGKFGNAEVDHFEIDERTADMLSLREVCNPGRREYIPPGRYCRLIVNGSVMMTDTPMEAETNTEAVIKANGDVLIAGLGLGVILLPILKKPEVKSVSVIENSSSVVELVHNTLMESLSPECASKLDLVCADIFDWKPPRGVKWDTIYFDIWEGICTDNLPEMTRLKRKFARRLKRENPNAWMGAWEEAHLRRKKRTGRW